MQLMREAAVVKEGEARIRAASGPLTKTGTTPLGVRLLLRATLGAQSPVTLICDKVEGTPNEPEQAMLAKAKA